MGFIEFLDIKNARNKLSESLFLLINTVLARTPIRIKNSK